MMSNHLADDLFAEYRRPIASYPRVGMGYGYNGAVVTDPGKADVPMGAGTYLWDGAFGSWFWIDPVYDIVFVGMVQSTNWFTWVNPRASSLEEASRGLVYQAMVRP
jgi:CubicO group peptidase (beta-lactamase class C family)